MALLVEMRGTASAHPFATLESPRRQRAPPLAGGRLSAVPWNVPPLAVWQTNLPTGIVFAPRGAVARLPHWHGKSAPKPGCRIPGIIQIFGQSTGARGPGEGHRMGGGKLDR